MATFSPIWYETKQGEPFVVRSATTDDAAAVLAHARPIIDEGQFVLMQPEEFNFTESDEREFIKKYSENRKWLMLVAEMACCIEGVLLFENSTRIRQAHAGTLHMSVSKSNRGRGIGGALLQSLIEWSEQNETIEKLCLSVFATNARAIGLYKKYGFVDEGQTVKSVKRGSDDYVDEILMYRFVK